MNRDFFRSNEKDEGWNDDHVTVEIHIQKTETKEVVKYEDEIMWYEGELDAKKRLPTEYYDCIDTWVWKEGNYSCDCNRGIFFDREKYSMEYVNEKDDDCYPCGDQERYLVNIYNPVNNKLLYKEFEE